MFGGATLALKVKIAAVDGNQRQRAAARSKKEHLTPRFLDGTGYVLRVSTKTPLRCDPHKIALLVRSGDIEAVDRLTRCFGDRLIAVGQSRCKTSADAEDAVQDALLAASEHLGDFRGEGSVEGWLVRMVVNACHRMRRGRKNDPSLHEVEATLVGDGAGPDELAGRGEMAIALGRALEGLAPKDRAILLMAEIEDWRGPEIAKELGMTPGAVRSRLSRARGRIRSELVHIVGDVRMSAGDLPG